MRGDLRNRIGDEAYAQLVAHDDVISRWADVMNVAGDAKTAAEFQAKYGRGSGSCTASNGTIPRERPSGRRRILARARSTRRRQTCECRGFTSSSGSWQRSKCSMACCRAFRARPAPRSQWHLAHPIHSPAPRDRRRPDRSADLETQPGGHGETNRRPNGVAKQQAMTWPLPPLKAEPCSRELACLAAAVYIPIWS